MNDYIFVDSMGQQGGEEIGRDGDGGGVSSVFLSPPFTSSFVHPGTDLSYSLPVLSESDAMLGAQTSSDQTVVGGILSYTVEYEAALAAL